MKKVISLSILLFLIGITAFASTATIQKSGTKKYKAVLLTPEIYNNANADLSDLLLCDDNQNVVPYFINSHSSSNQTQNISYQTELVNSFVKDEFFYYDYKVLNSTEKDISTTSLQLNTTTTNFAKRIEIAGSYDNIAWEKVKNDTIYNVDGNVKLVISFNTPQKYLYYRFKISNNLEKLSFDTVTADFSETKSNINYFIKELTPNYHIEQKDKNTIITIGGLKNCKLNEITLQTDSIFKRDANFANGQTKRIYNLEFNDMAYNDTILPFNGYQIKDDTVTISIANKDDKPIDIQSIIVTYLADEVVFEGKGENYTLSFGDKDARKPNYDIVNYKDLILKDGYDVLSIDGVAITQSKKEAAPYDYSFIFNTVIIVVAILLGIIILAKLRRK